MYIKVINPSKHGTATYSNTSSCSNLVEYLGKENESLAIDKREMFFNHIDDQISSNAVIKMIDNNVKGIAKGRTRFNSLVIAPDKEEQEHIKNDPVALKKYTCEVMKAYAENFHLKSGKKLGVDDLVWAAKLEYERNGNNEGNMHVHVIISARDMEQKITLSPNTNDKNRFNRVSFYLESEKVFDKLFQYERLESKLKTDQMIKHGNLHERDKYFAALDEKRSQIQTNEISRPITQGILSVNSQRGQYQEEFKKKKVKKRNSQNLKL